MLRTAVSVVFMMLVMPVGFAASASDIPTTDAELVEAQTLRAELGLTDDAAAVAELMSSDRDVGSADWGIPMTTEEFERVDLVGRMGFADAVDARLGAFLQSRASFAGMYFDPGDDGAVTILLTGSDAAAEREIEDQMAGLARSWRIEMVAHAEKELFDAAERGLSMAQDIDAAVRVVGLGVDTRANGLFIGVPSSETDAAKPIAEELSTDLGVAVDVRAMEPPMPSHCTLRTHCHGPTAAGVTITNGAGTCTMGFHIVQAGDAEFVTSGHCSFNTFGNNWSHAAIGALGAPVQWMYFQNGQDILRSNLTAAQESDNVFAEGDDIIGMGVAAQGETLCASLGAGSNAIKCGTVTTTWVSYNFGAAWGNFDLWGADMSYTTVGGDSGSPVYRRIPGGTGDRMRAIGVSSSNTGLFARLDQSLDNFGATVFN